MWSGSGVDAGGARWPGRLRGTAGCVAIAVAAAIVTASAQVPAVYADAPEGDIQSANASNGGIASATIEGNVSIGEIVTGENAGNTIVTGDIAGAAALDGGEIAYPTDVSVSLEIGPPTLDASGGDGGEAKARPGDESAQENADGDIKIVNKNDNRSSAIAEG